MPLLTVQFPTFRVEHHADGTTVTHYPDGTCSPVQVNADHALHAEQIGPPMTPALFNLGHELAHHLIGIHVREKETSPIIWGAAHRKKGKPTFTGQIEEWLANELQYYAAGGEVLDFGALMDIQKKVSPRYLARLLNWLLEGARLGGVGVVLGERE